MSIRRVLATVVLSTAFATTLSACGATDNLKTAKAGLNTASYLKAIQPQLSAYGQTISTLQAAGPVSAEKATRLSVAARKLRTIESELKGISASDD